MVVSFLSLLMYILIVLPVLVRREKGLFYLSAQPNFASIFFSVLYFFFFLFFNKSLQFPVNLYLKKPEAITLVTQ